MYINRDHAFTDLHAMHALMDAHPLGAWVLQDEAGLVANHIPFLLDRSQGPHGTLIGHVARANPAWRMLDAQAPSLVIFQGPDSYITPNWYPGKAAHGKVVPTWDYAVVHAHGVARAVEDPAWLLYMLERLTDRQEAAQPVPWKVKDAPRAYIDKLLRAIVGIEFRIERLKGKLKASQDEAREDRLGTAAGLRGSGNHNAAAMANLIEGTLNG
jgi:transcriptional regulator